MKCRSARILIHLLDGGDATRREIHRLERHLGGCADCRRYELELAPLALTEFRVEPPLTETDYASIRHSVMNEISQGRGALLALAWRVAVPAIAVAVLIMIGVGVWRGGRAPIELPAESPSQVTPRPDPRIAELDRAATIAAERTGEIPSAPADVTETAPRLTEVAASSLPSVAPSAVPVPGRVSTVRIELETRNPNIRIIWIANTEEQHPRGTPSMSGT